MIAQEIQFSFHAVCLSRKSKVARPKINLYKGVWATKKTVTHSRSKKWGDMNSEIKALTIMGKEKT